MAQALGLGLKLSSYVHRGLPDLAVNFKFQINNQQFFSINMSQILHRAHL